MRGIPLSNGFVAQINEWPSYPNPQTDLSHAYRFRRAQGGKAIQNRGTDLKFGNLPVKVPRLAEACTPLAEVHHHSCQSFPLDAQRCDNWRASARQVD